MRPQTAQIEKALYQQSEAAIQECCGLIGSSLAMRNLLGEIERAAACDVAVLISGETGTGKEQVAREIHSRSSRATGPFVALNCGALLTSLMQSEVFGYTEDTLTRADEPRRSRVEAASGGTLLLDEIGDLPPNLQASLLGFLDNHFATPRASRDSEKVDVRIIASTSKDLEQLVKKRVFLSDLYSRLAALVIDVPKLKRRGDDLFLLADYFLQEAMTATGITVSGFNKNALEALRSHSWPGNLRELRYRVFQAVLQSSGPWITRDDLQLKHKGEQESPASLQVARDKAERAALKSTLHRTHWNMSEAAKRLKISRMTLYRLAEKHGLTRGQ